MSDIVREAEFLIERLRSFEGDNMDEASFRDWNGHVSPSISRLEALLKAARAQRDWNGEAVYFYRHPASDPNNWREIPKATYDIQREDRFFDNHKYRILYNRPQPEDNWIKCSERMPELEGHYDAYAPSNGGRWPDAYWSGENWEDEMDGTAIKGVTRFCIPSIPPAEGAER